VDPVAALLEPGEDEAPFGNQLQHGRADPGVSLGHGEAVGAADAQVDLEMRAKPGLNQRRRASGVASQRQTALGGAWMSMVRITAGMRGLSILPDGNIILNP
jgi:hypothetical protein